MTAEWRPGEGELARLQEPNHVSDAAVELTTTEFARKGGMGDALKPTDLVREEVSVYLDVYCFSLNLTL